METKNYDTTSDKLRPYPFCGSQPIWFRKGNAFTKSQMITVKCPNCRIQRTDAILNNHGHTIEWLEEIVVKNWNQRTNK